MELNKAQKRPGDRPYPIWSAVNGATDQPTPHDVHVRQHCSRPTPYVFPSQLSPFSFACLMDTHNCGFGGGGAVNARFWGLHESNAPVLRLTRLAVISRKRLSEYRATSVCTYTVYFLGPPTLPCAYLLGLLKTHKACRYRSHTSLQVTITEEIWPRPDRRFELPISLSPPNSPCSDHSEDQPCRGPSLSHPQAVICCSDMTRYGDKSSSPQSSARSPYSPCGRDTTMHQLARGGKRAVPQQTPFYSSRLLLPPTQPLYSPTELSSLLRAS